ncbi:HDOD domain-containing protein [Solidesulfovibrio sp.]|uniref:HDOD domain-containing protein n=1 Tax=Solidesulfovibrio sp. TaxID=2910990 RepID=UPI002B211779|nr:HDOD domain-containing protein [Solidesulfovibrio sp.]MEA4854972.1 HDOD domain-containing protein [Solidesulfovibrio sp.]
MSLTLAMLVVAAGIGLLVVFRILSRTGRAAPDPAPGGDWSAAPWPDESSARTAPDSGQSPDGRLLAGCLAALLGGEDASGDCGPELFALPARPWPAGLARGLSRLSAGAAGGEALRRLQDPSVSPRQLAESIAADPVLTGHVLKIANSPLFGLRSSVASLHQAIGTMGLSNLRMLLYSEILESAGARAGLAAPLRRELWPHLGATAVLARHIAPAFPDLDAGMLFTAGILHDIGRLALYGPGDTAFCDDPREESARFGVNHAVAGGAACLDFDLPRGLAEAVRLHHAAFYVEMEDLDAAVADIRLALALALADRLAHGLEAGEGGCDEAGAATPVLASYRFLLRGPILADCLRNPRLHTELAQARGLLRLG